MAVRPETSPRNKKPAQYNSYLKYGGLAFQLLATIGICGWLGYKADQYMGNKYPIFMLILGFIGFSGIMYQVYSSIKGD